MNMQVILFRRTEVRMRSLAVLMVLGVVAVCYSDLPLFAAPFYVQANGVDLVVHGSIPDPFVVDWDYDGVKDLIIGQFSGGKIRFYKNSGTNAEPVFTTYEFLKADGVDITMAYG